MRIAIFGASGAVGRTLLVHLLKGTDLISGDEIVLVGRGDLENRERLLAIRTDLLDAFETGAVDITVCQRLEDLIALDIFIMAAGATVGDRITHRSQLASENLALFRSVAETASRQCPDAFFLIISNPVELAVQVFCDFLGRRRVVGMGAQQDSLRFARAIAGCLALPRTAVRASVLGEHGPRMVPLWSSVFLVDESPEMLVRLEALKRNCNDETRSTSIEKLQEEWIQEIAQSHFEQAHRMLSAAQPDLRILVEPFLTVTLLRSTPNATANATLDCIAAIRQSDGRTVHGQVMLAGEFCGIHGVLGTPLALRRAEWGIGSHLPLATEEVQRLRAVASELREEYSALLGLRAGNSEAVPHHFALHEEAR